MLRLFLALWIAITPACAWAGSMSLLGAGKPGTVAASYTGPGDVVATAEGWWGLRAYSAATKGNKAVNVCNVSDVTCVDMSTDATTGALVVGTVGGSDCSAVVCTIKTFYDQSGANSCSAAACDLTNATIANRPQLLLNCIGSLPCAKFVGSSSQKLVQAGTTSVSQPQTVSAAVQRNAAFTATGSYYGDKTQNGLASFNSAANQFQLYSGVSLIVSISDSAFHAVNAIFNNTSSNVNIDGTDNTGNAGPDALGIGTMGSDTFGNSFTGFITELGMWSGSFNSTQLSNMSSNQKAYWGF